MAKHSTAGWWIALGVTVVVCAATLAPTTADAATATHVAGTFGVADYGNTECAPGSAPGTLRCVTTGFVSSYDGSLVGQSSADFVQLINCVSGQVQGHGVESFSGSVNGSAPGTATWPIVFSASFDCETFAVWGFIGLGVITDSSGGLGGARGTLHFGDGTYTGILR
jgi:hypothetical protein